MSERIKGMDLRGRVFGRLVVVEFEGSFKKPTKGCEKRWLCRCECGATKSISQPSLFSGHSSSCGCLHREQMSARFKKHGDSGTKLHNVWCTMKQRCNNPNDKGYKNYGGRGIKICKRWESFENFKADMGPTYREGLEIERRDNDGGYDDFNCTWATRLEQVKNRRDYRKKFEYDGKLTTYRELAEQWSVAESTAEARVRLSYNPKNFKV